MTTSKKFLSNKKVEQQSISISPALKDWIKRYVNVNHKKDPNNENYKSISAFYNYAMANLMNLFKEGKTFEDFKRVEDTEYKDVFDRFTFKATVPLYDMVAESNRYNTIPFEFITSFLMFVYRLYKKNIRKNNYEDLQLIFERFKNRVYPSNITKELSLEIFKEKDQRFATGVFVFIGKQRNLHFENCKFFAAVFGLLGIRVADFTYSAKDFYCRLDLVETDLLFRDDLAKKERIKLLNENVKFITNFDVLLEDKDDKHLWMKLAEDPLLFITFKNKKTFDKWIGIIKKDVQKFTVKDNLSKKILSLFEKLHWIRIINDKDSSFQIEQSMGDNSEQTQWLINYLSKISNISQTEGIYYLKD
ncbi:MAG: hypothetical protein ACFFCI_08075 [Promethearchaeota archaeon]